MIEVLYSLHVTFYEYEQIYIWIIDNDMYLNYVGMLTHSISGFFYFKNGQHNWKFACSPCLFLCLSRKPSSFSSEKEYTMTKSFLSRQAFQVGCF